MLVKLLVISYSKAVVHYDEGALDKNSKEEHT